MSKEFIGVLDSGVGGLSVLRELYNLMPDKNYVYFGDTKNMPYGVKTPQEIFQFTKEILNFFVKKNIKNVVFACNTTSAVAYSNLAQHFSDKLKIFPLIQSVASSAANGLKDNDTIAILATKATINSHKYKEEINKINPKIKVEEFNCTGFVEIVENRLYEDEKSIELIKSVLEKVRECGAKKAVLGCTHYPYLVDIFKNILDIEYFNPANCLANIVKKELKNSNNNEKGEVEFFVSKNPEEFILSGKTFFEIEKAQLIKL